MTWTAENSHYNESLKIKWELVPYTRGRGLDLGCGPYKPFSHFIGVDNGSEKWGLQGANLSHDCADLSIFASQTFDFVYSSHLLEEIPDTQAALKEWCRVIKPGGYLCLYLPHKDFYPNVGEEGANLHHLHDFLPSDIIEAMKTVPGGWELVENQERNEGDEYSFFQVYKRVQGKGLVEKWQKDRPAKSCCVVRYGGFGDQIQTSAVLSKLKEDGWHITVMTQPEGKNILTEDPHIDAWIIQDRNQVPNNELGAYWAYWEKKFDKWVNLCESVEATFLAVPGRTPYKWAHKARHRFMNLNYLEHMMDIADLEGPGKMKFYPTKEEKAWARKIKSKHSGPVIVWTLAGSSVHKTWGQVDELIARILLIYKQAHVYFVGDEYCQILEQGWEREPRVHLKSGKWGIRETLAFAQSADLVIGPETGVLNAVAHEETGKVIFLSHSSVENLTKGWINTVSLVPEGCECYPCHKLHYENGTCNVLSEGIFDGIADCQAKISLEQAWKGVTSILNMNEKAA